MSKRRWLIPGALIGALALSGCTNPYDPGQRAAGGALIGAGSGAALGGIVGGGHGAAVGALIGAGAGALGGYATTPNRAPLPAYGGYYGPPPPPRPAYGGYYGPPPPPPPPPQY